MIIFTCSNKMCGRYATEESCFVACVIKDEANECLSCPYDHCVARDCQFTALPSAIHHICHKGVHRHVGHS